MEWKHRSAVAADWEESTTVLLKAGEVCFPPSGRLAAMGLRASVPKNLADVEKELPSLLLNCIYP